jgi:hypothetical protein
VKKAHLTGTVPQMVKRDYRKEKRDRQRAKKEHH